MHFGAIPDNPMDRIVLAAGLAPEPLLHTQFYFVQARAIMAAVDVGIFEALAEEARTAEEIAKVCEADPRATGALLRALVGARYLGYERRSRRYRLRAIARKWMLRDSPHSLAHKMLFQRIEWQFLDSLESFVRTGKAMDLHLSHDPALWGSYQAGMADLGRLSLSEVVSRTPVPRSARRMLDIGGAGGTYSGAFLRRYPGLEGTILDLPDAVPHARRLVAEQGLGSRLTIEAGDILTDDLGESAYDFVFMSMLAHHFDRDQNLAVTRKVRRALKPGGVFVIQDVERAAEPSAKNQFGGLMDLYFTLTSRSGTWSMEEMTDWLRAAGLDVRRPVRMRTSPGLSQAVGRLLANAPQ